MTLVERLNRWAAFGYGVEASATMTEAAARITALEAENARLREGVSEIEKVAGHCERINLIGKTPEAKLAGTLRNILIRTRTLLERQTDD